MFVDRSWHVDCAPSRAARPRWRPPQASTASPPESGEPRRRARGRRQRSAGSRRRAAGRHPRRRSHRRAPARSTSSRRSAARSSLVAAVAGPPSCQRRKIVRADARRGETRITLRHQKRSVRVALEVEEARRERPCGMPCVRESLRVRCLNLRRRPRNDCARSRARGCRASRRSG